MMITCNTVTATTTVDRGYLPRVPLASSPLSSKKPLSQALREVSTPNTMEMAMWNMRMYAEHDPPLGGLTRRGTGEKMRR